MNPNPYSRLAARLNALPNGFPPAPDGAELRLLEKLFTPEEAGLAAELRLTLETPIQIANRLRDAGWENVETKDILDVLKGMARKGLIVFGRSENGAGFGLMPFVVGIYEEQNGRMDAELARLAEDYFRFAFGQMLTIQPTFHRVVPVGESVRMDLEIRPFESASEIVKNAQAWGVVDCICRTQKALIGEACSHPVDVCLVLSKKAGAFDHGTGIRALALEEALGTLQRAAQAGLVHSVSNILEENSYICNCCTCACGILRGVAELGMANVIAHSAFINQVDEDLCSACETCVDLCQFGALFLEQGLMHVNPQRCVGCGVCVPSCPYDALELVRRPVDEILSIPSNDREWQTQRALARGIDIQQVL